VSGRASAALVTEAVAVDNDDVPLRPELQAIVDTLLAAHPEGLSLNELSEELLTKPVTYADIDEIIGALEDAGVDLDGPDHAASPEQLAQVLATARTLSAETGQHPTPEAIAARAGLTPVVVRRALRLGRTIGQ
jgi:hypothetical protein